MERLSFYKKYVTVTYQLVILDCITIKDLIQHPDYLKTIELSHNRIINVLKEANQLTN